MPLPHSLSRGLSLGKSKEPKYENPRPRPALSRSKTTTSALQRSFNKSKFFSGRQPPRSNSSLTSEQILDLTYMLSQPIYTPLLTTSIASLSPPLTRSNKSSPAHCLCDVHTWFDLRWIDELTAIIGEELGPRLDNLRSAPSQLRSVQTDEILGMLQSYAHILPADDPDGSRMANPYQCNIRDCAVCSITSCRACKLSQFFQNGDAVKALNICVKGRKKRNRPWPEACAWLDPEPGRGWEMKWKKEGLPVLTDRIIIRAWRKAGGPERLTAAMASVQIKVLADKEAVEKGLDAVTRLSTASEETMVQSAYDGIVERKWTTYEEAMKSTETLNLLRKLGMDDDEGEEHTGERRADSFEAAYHNLMGTSTESHSRPSSHDHGIQEEVGRCSRVSSLASTSPNSQARSSRASSAASRMSTISEAEATLANGRSRSSSRSSVDEPPYGRGAQSMAASYFNYIGSMPHTQSKLSVYHEGEHEQGGSDGKIDNRTVSHPRSLRRSRAQSKLSADSWAVFSNSPLGKWPQA